MINPLSFSDSSGREWIVDAGQVRSLRQIPDGAMVTLQDGRELHATSTVATLATSLNDLYGEALTTVEGGT